MKRNQALKSVTLLAGLAVVAAAAVTRADDSGAAEVTYSREISRLIQENCQSCHRPGESAPMAFMDYAGVRPWAKSIREAVSSRSMPPWFADPAHGTFANDRRLTEEQIDMVSRWVAAGAPEGDPADLPEPVEYVEGWRIGTPDLILTADEPYVVQAEGILDYIHIEVGPFPVDRWVTKLEIRPSNRLVAHHMNLFRDLPREEDESSKKKEARSRREFVTGFVPGGIETTYPEGTAQFFPKGTKLVLQCHYVTIGTEQEDQPSIGFIFAREPVEQQIYNVLISNYTFAIPPNDPDHEVRAQWIFREPITVIGAMVHMHLRGKDYKFVAKYPDGREETLLSVPEYDFEWQLGYHFKDRPRIPAKGIIQGIAHMDNSSGNEFNPDPTATVRYGPQTYDEMVMGFVFYTKDGESLADNEGAKNLGPITSQVGGVPGEEPSAGAGN